MEKKREKTINWNYKEQIWIILSEYINIYGTVNLSKH